MNTNYYIKLQNQLAQKPIKVRLIRSQINLILLLATGMTLKEIAIKEGKQENNIKKRTQNLYKKFLVANRKDLILKAIKQKIIKFKDISPKFRKRFFRENEIYNNFYSDITIKEELNAEEIKILTLLSKGFTKKQIIKELRYINIHYYNMILYGIFAKLHVENKIQAVYMAIKNKIIEI